MSLQDHLLNLKSTVFPYLAKFQPHSHLQILQAPIPHLTSLLTHLSTQPIHPTYFPYSQLTVLHATKVALVWSIMTKGKDRKRIGLLGDLWGYLVLAWGGGTLVSLLLGLPPSWLISPNPWIIYPTIYLLLNTSRMASYITTTSPSLLLNISFSLIDGLTRGSIIANLPKTLPSSIINNIWTVSLLSGIATSGGGWIIQLLGLNEDTWKLGKPTILDGGIWNTLDLWAGMVTGLVNSIVQRNHSDLSIFSDRVLGYMPKEHLYLSKKGKVVRQEVAVAISAMTMGGLMLLRVLVLAFVGRRRKFLVGRTKNKQVSMPLPGSGVGAGKNEKAEVLKGLATPENKATKRKPKSRSATPSKAL